MLKNRLQIVLICGLILSAACLYIAGYRLGLGKVQLSQHYVNYSQYNNALETLLENSEAQSLRNSGWNICDRRIVGLLGFDMLNTHAEIDLVDWPSRKPIRLRVNLWTEIGVPLHVIQQKVSTTYEADLNALTYDLPDDNYRAILTKAMSLHVEEVKKKLYPNFLFLWSALCGLPLSCTGLILTQMSRTRPNIETFLVKHSKKIERIIFLPFFIFLALQIAWYWTVCSVVTYIFHCDPKALLGI
ncbi:MAG: hypothetical protein K2X81_29500 [Candidatus Obscuribacterales bacterium]|nr:hypothetical protein [Candidatus Obscuribacterales bacterium]